jgi:hypothetical protein
MCLSCKVDALRPLLSSPLVNKRVRSVQCTFVLLSMSVLYRLCRASHIRSTYAVLYVSLFMMCESVNGVFMEGAHVINILLILHFSSNVTTRLIIDDVSFNVIEHQLSVQAIISSLK